MGWYDCFDFIENKFTQPDAKAPEIYRVLRPGGKIVCCSWEAQADLAWMEDAMLRHYPELIEDEEYLDQRPIGMAYEKPAGYQVVLQAAGFRNLEITQETVECLSTDEEEWWRQMQNVGWKTLIEKIAQNSPQRMQEVKQAIFRDLQPFHHPDGIHFTKSVFYVSALK